jgi:hypothetical protein
MVGEELEYIRDWQFTNNLVFLKLTDMEQGTEVRDYSIISPLATYSISFAVDSHLQITVLNECLRGGIFARLKVLKVSNVLNATEEDLKNLLGFMGHELCKLTHMQVPSMLFNSTVIRQWLNTTGHVYAKPALDSKSAAAEMLGFDLSSNRLQTIGGNFLFKHCIRHMTLLRTLKLRHANLEKSLPMLWKVCLESKALHHLHSLNLHNNNIDSEGDLAVVFMFVRLC